MQYDTDHCFYDRAGDHTTLMVVFNYFDQPLSVRSHYNAISKLPCNRLFLNSGKNDWFQTGIPGISDSFEETISFCKKIKSDFKEERIVYVGHSMGAFAALGCGIAAGADRILASAPETELVLSGSISSEYLAGKHIPYPSVEKHLEANKKTKIWVIYGERDPFDRAVGLAMRKHKLVSPIPLKCGHTTFPYLQQNNILTDVLRAFLEDDDVADIVKKLRSLKPAAAGAPCRTRTGTPEGSRF